ncbi:MAG: chromosomal replication initiator protein DnaA [Clostridia bacterium]|nr:chromosomal replication initiator protein DnaA [Clostridia bacterium]
MENIKEAWSGILEYLRNQDDISEVAFNMWITCIEPCRIEENRVVVLVHTDFQRSIIAGQYTQKIKDAFLQVLGIPFDLEIQCKEKPEPTPAVATPQPDLPAADFPAAENLFGKKSSDYEYSFENFVVGPSNKFAHAASQAVASKPAGSYNPLFIYGGSGLGKTHLLYAICNEIRRNSPQMKILYTKGEFMTNELVEAIRDKCPEEFRAKYRQVDLLLIDDIQFIAGKVGFQEEFFHTFEALWQANKQIVLTSDRPPREIATLEERLRTRFEMGLLADIQPPDLETRIAIIKRKAQLLDITIGNDVAEYIATQLKSNVRQLEGAVRRMQAQCMLEGEAPSIMTAQAAIRDIKNDSQPVPITVERIINEVARTMSVSPEDIRSNKHSANISSARQVAEYVVRNITNLPMKAIGEEFGGRDHSTVVYAIQKVEDRMAVNPSFKGLVNDIIKNISES